MATTRPAPDSSDHSITGLLAQLAEGNREAGEKLIAQVYGELRCLAKRQMRNERAGHTLQPTALVNEAYLRLLKQPMRWQNRAHFFAVASQVMRQILVDYARARRSQKRGGDILRVTLTEEIALPDAHTLDVLELNELLEGLEKLDPKLSRLLELHYFGGLSNEEIAHVMGVSSKTVKRWYDRARAWLRTRRGQ